MSVTDTYYARSDAKYITVQMDNPSFAQAVHVPCPSNGFIAKVQVAISAAFTTADETLTISANGNGKSVDVVLDQVSSAAGQVSWASCQIPVTMNDSIHATSAGTSGGTYKARIVYTIIPTGI